MNATAYLYVFDTMADWEIGYITAELNSGRYFRKELPPMKIMTVGIDRVPVTTMGGLRIVPDLVVKECSMQKADVLILPGGFTWAETKHDPILDKIAQCLEKDDDMVIAAICGATEGLARKGLLDSRQHTSNDLGYLKMVCPTYHGEKNFEEGPVASDGRLITASGIAPLEFAYHILRAVDVFAPQTLDAWYHLYKTHEPRYFHELMSSIQ